MHISKKNFDDFSQNFFHNFFKNFVEHFWNVYGTFLKIVSEHFFDCSVLSDCQTGNLLYVSPSFRLKLTTQFVVKIARKLIFSIHLPRIVMIRGPCGPLVTKKAVLNSYHVSVRVCVRDLSVFLYSKDSYLDFDWTRVREALNLIKLH